MTWPEGGVKVLLTFILRLFFLLVGNMHRSQVGTLGVWRDSSHPPNPPPPFKNLNYASFWGKVSLVHVSIHNRFCCGNVSHKYSDRRAILGELKLFSSPRIEVDY